MAQCDKNMNLNLLLPDAAGDLIGRVALPPDLLGETRPLASRAAIAAALNLQLLSGLLARVPSGRAYFEERAAEGEKLVFDHGAMRTVAMDGMGNLPAGRQAITRILEPLGYECSHLYPLPDLKMTGRSYTHRDFPEALPQFFVSELHPERFSQSFQAAVRRVTASSSDALAPSDMSLLAALGRDGTLPVQAATELLPRLANCFTCRHGTPRAADYAILRAESAEMAWIATEGNAFNHATDRVGSLDDVVARQRALGRPMKDEIEISASGRVRQTAFHADPVSRAFLDEAGKTCYRDVPGSFFEFIQRSFLPGENRLDLAFDTGNAQGIFKMTAA